MAREAGSRRKTAAPFRPHGGGEPFSKKGRTAGGLAAAAPEILVHVDGLRKVYLKPELISQPGSQCGKVEGTLGWNLEAGVESQLHHLVTV